MIAFLSIITVTAVVFFLSLAWALLYREHDPAKLHWSTTLPILGGPIPPTHAWIRYHFRYYCMILLFLLFIAFEMEMMFMYPWAIVYVQEGIGSTS